MSEPTDDTAADLDEVAALEAAALGGYAWSIGPEAAGRLAARVRDLESAVEDLQIELVELSADAERVVRREERLRLAALFEEHAEALGAVAQDGNLPLELVVLLLRLDHG